MDNQPPTATTPTPVSPTTGNISNLSPSSNLPPSQLQPSQQPRKESPCKAKSPKKLLYLGSFIILIVSLFLLSFFFLKNQRQPKTNSRAASPSLSPTTPISQPPTSVSHSGFGSLVKSSPTSPTDQISPTSSSLDRRSLGEGGPSTPNLSSQPNTDNPQPTTNNPQPTTLPAQAGNDQRPSRVIFDITAANNSFKPNLLDAYNNQIIVFNVWATDKDYDISIAEFGVKKIFKMGTRSSMEFQATSFGQYTFTCTDNCSGSDTAKGLLTIKP